VITVVDTTAPQFVGDLPGDVTVECDAVPRAATLTATDNCDSDVAVSFDEQRADGSCPDGYTLTRTWTATDDCGNSTPHAQVITVVDRIAPQFVGDLPGDVTVECNAVPSAPALTATDNCDSDVDVALDEQTESGNCADGYTLTRTWTATDDCGNSTPHVQVVTVIDTTDPSVTCSGEIRVQCLNDVPEPDVHSVSASDNCDADVEIAWVDDVSDGNTCPETITRTYRATDDCGNSDTCTQSIIVNDTTVPSISCPNEIRIECAGDVPEPDPGSVSASDNCDRSVDVVWVDDVSDGNTYPETITRTYRATDDCGNSATCGQSIIINDDTPPVITCPAAARFECDETVVFGEPTAEDNCDTDLEITWNDETVRGDCGNEYQIVRTWTATDDGGNSASCEQTITVFDETPPAISCPSDITFECDQMGDAGEATCTDNCDSNPAVTSSDRIEPGRCAQAYTIVRTWRAEDDCGNVSTCDQRMDVEDTLPPEVTCPADTSFEVGETIVFGQPTVRDRCDGDVEVTFKDVRFASDCPQAYSIVRTWTATDDCGNSASCEQTVTIGDETPPVITCPGDKTFECNQTVVFGQATAVDVGDPNPVITFVDNVIPGNCGQARVIERTWIATDACGNADSCLQVVRVVDSTAPVVTCPANRTFSCDVQPEFGMATATDNCDTAPVITYTDRLIPGSNAQEYVIKRTWKATDACGNVGSCVQTVTVEDTTAPVLVGAPDGAILCDQPVVFTDPSVTDNCDAAPVVVVVSDTVEEGPGECEASYTRCWEAHDAAGNVSDQVCQTIVRYEDTEAPVINCPTDKTVEPGEVVAFDSPEVTDNCPVVTAASPQLTSILRTTVAQEETTYTMCWVAYDMCGNQSDECCQNITVMSEEPDEPYCSFVCWNWTAACLKDPYNHEISTPPACLRDEHFDDVFPNGVTIGTHASPGLYTATWTSAGAVEDFKCGYGLPEALHANWVDPSNTDLGALQAEILTLRLNREFSCAGYFEAYGYPMGEGCFGDLIVPLEGLRFAGLTVDQFLAIADRAVAGDKSALLPYGYSYNRLHSTAAYLNWLYGECNGYGSRNASGPITVGGTDGDAGWENEVDEAVPTEFSMTGSPNPTRGNVTISLALPADGDLSLDIYDVQGRVVTTLMRGHKSAGYYSVTWDGADGFGARVASGVYFCRVQIDGQLAAMEKLMKL
jgi:hypothetical protein